MKIVIAGGTGQVGTILARAFEESGYEVVVLSRQGTAKIGRTVLWDGEALGQWTAEIDGADAVINLAGRSVNCRYNAHNRRLIVESRVKSTRIIGAAIAQAAHPARVWLQASTATIYAHHYDAANDETTGVIGGQEQNAPDTWHFSIEVARAWERALNEANLPQTRKVLLRSAMVMSPDRGGVFDVLLSLVRYGLGGKMGNGQQYVSWIHEQDFVRAVRWLLTHPELDGPLNLTAPNPLPNTQFMQTLRAAWGTPFGLPAAKWLLELGAIALRTETELVLKSRRVTPGRLLASGFTFDYPTWAEATRDLCQCWREKQNPDPAFA